MHARPAIFTAAFVAMWIFATSGVTQTPLATPRGDVDCAPRNGFGFICGVPRPEDLKHIPGTRWVITSGFIENGGLKLIDTDAKTAKPWFTGRADEIRHDKKRYGLCPGAPNAAALRTQGLSLRAGARQGVYTLLVANHGGRESIELFEVDARGLEPKPIWIGCVPMPKDRGANAVASFSDGTILATQLTHPGFTLADQVQGRVTGGVYQWRPGEAGFTLLPGTQLPGNNGIEVSLDDREFYVIAFGIHTIFVFDRANPSRAVRSIKAPGFMPDNLAWDPVAGGAPRLVMAGMMADEPACGGTRKVVNGVADGMRCPRGYMVGALDPKTMTFSIIDYGEPNPDFNGVSSAVVVGDNIWLGSYQADRIAWRPLAAARNPLPPPAR